MSLKKMDASGNDSEFYRPEEPSDNRRPKMRRKSNAKKKKCNKMMSEQNMETEVIKNSSSEDESEFIKCKYCSDTSGSKVTTDHHDKHHNELNLSNDSTGVIEKCQKHPSRHKTAASNTNTRNILRKCQYCNFESNLQADLYEHYAECHKSEKVWFKITDIVGEVKYDCPRCSFRFSTLNDYNEHDCPVEILGNNVSTSQSASKMAHIDMRMLICRGCGYQSSIKKDYFIHLRGCDKLYRCNSCMYKTESSCKLDLHYRSAHNIAPFICGSCTYNTVISENYYTHLSTNECFTKQSDIADPEMSVPKISSVFSLGEESNVVHENSSNDPKISRVFSLVEEPDLVHEISSDDETENVEPLQNGFENNNLNFADNVTQNVRTTENLNPYNNSPVLQVPVSSQEQLELDVEEQINANIIIPCDSNTETISIPDSESDSEFVETSLMESQSKVQATLGASFEASEIRLLSVQEAAQLMSQGIPVIHQSTPILNATPATPNGEIYKCTECHFECFDINAIKTHLTEHSSGSNNVCDKNGSSTGRRRNKKFRAPSFKAFHLFSQKARGKLNRLYPNLKKREILRKISAMWRDLPDAEKLRLYDEVRIEEALILREKLTSD